MTIETLGEIRAKYNFWNEKERPYYEALSEAIRVLNAQKDKCHYAKIVRCRECRYRITSHGISDGWVLCSKPYTEKGNAMHRADWFCADGEREVQE